MLDQETIASNDSTSATTKNAVQKLDNPDTEPGVSEANTAPSPAPRPNQYDTAQVEELEWEIRKITGKRRTSLGWEYEVVWARSWVPQNELGNAQKS